MGAAGPREAWQVAAAGVPACRLQLLPERLAPGSASPTVHPAAQVLLLYFAHMRDNSQQIKTTKDQRLRLQSWLCQ